MFLFYVNEPLVMSPTQRILMRATKNAEISRRNTTESVQNCKTILRLAAYALAFVINPCHNEYSE